MDLVKELSFSCPVAQSFCMGPITGALKGIVQTKWLYAAYL